MSFSQIIEKSGKIITHNLGTIDVITQIYNIETGDTAKMAVSNVDENSIKVEYNNIADDNKYRVVIQSI